VALDFTNGGSNNGRLSRATNPPVTAVPLTISAWVRRQVAIASVDLVTLCDTPGTGTNYFELLALDDSTGVGGFGGGGGLQCYAMSGGASSGAAFTAGVPNLSASEWHHACGVWSSAVNRAAFIDGGNKATNGTSVTPSGIAQTVIGQASFNTGGSISDVAIWNVALSDAEVLALARGMSPLFVRPSGLIAYWPLDTIASQGLNRVRGTTDRTLTVTQGAVAQASAGPPVGERYYFRPVGWRGGYTWIPGLQPAPGTDAFWKAGSDAATTNAAGYTNEAGKLVGVSLIQAVPGAALVASAFATASPAIGAATLVQTQALAAPAMAVASPAFSALAVTQGHALLASNASAGAPILDAPAANQKVVFTIPAFAVASPVFAPGFVAQAGALAAVPLAVGAPAIGAPVLAQKQVLAAAALAVASPVPGIAALAQNHALAPAGIAVASPQLGVGVSQQNYHLVAAGLAVSAPAVGAASITNQRHVFAAAALTISTPLLAPGALKQKHAIIATGAAAGSPVISAPVVSAGRAFVATALAVAKPVFGVAGIKQLHKLAAPRLSLSSGPIVGASKAVIKAPPLFAANLTVAPPTISPLGATVGFVNILTIVPDFHTGKIEFSHPDAELIGPPELFFPVREKRWSTDPKAEFYDDDHSQFGARVKQAIFANMNDAIEMWMSSGTLAGRTDRERGPVQDIIVGAPLWLADRKLRIDWSEVDQLRDDVNALIAAVTANTAQVAANVAAISANTAQVAANTAGVAANAALLAGLKSDLDKLQRQLKVYISRDLVAGAPILGTPRAATRLPSATNLVVASPALGNPVLVRIV
jgi:hypothetical protein